MRERDRFEFDRMMQRRRSHEFGMRIGSALLLLWLAVGLLAAGQRNYFLPGPINCAGFGTIALTAAAGPLNYMGVNPKVADCPTPSE